MTELWQRYDEQGQPLPGEGASKDDTFTKGLLHAASYVWMWRRNPKTQAVEILLQKRATTKRTWPNRYDISAAGHIDLGETPLQAAIRETQEELDLQVDATALRCIGVHRVHLTAGKNIENEYQWLYLLELAANTPFNLQDGEVASLTWKSVPAI